MNSLNDIHGVKRMRLILKWSQLKLAQELGVSQTFIYQVENNFRDIPNEIREKLDGIKRKHKVKV